MRRPAWLGSPLKVGTALVAVAAVGGAAYLAVGRTGDDERTVIPPSTDRLRACDGRGAGGWSFNAYVSENDGLVLGTSSLAGRQMTRLVSVPYLELDASEGEPDAARRVELSPDPDQAHDGTIGTELVDFDCTASGADEIGVTATYRAKDLFRADSERESTTADVLRVTQTYTFRAPDDQDCEPTGTFECARFWPTLSYEYEPPVSTDPIPSFGEDDPDLPAADFAGVTTVQRFEFAPDGSDEASIDAFSDQPGLGGTGVETKGSGSRTESSMRYEGTGSAIENGDGGLTQNTWDSIHISPERATTLPGTDPTNLGAGCPSCVHMHWRWGLLTNTGVVLDALKCSLVPVTCITPPGSWVTDGNPMIPDGSSQNAEFGIVRASSRAAEVDPVSLDDGWRALVDDEGTSESELRGHAPVVFWEMSSGSTADSTFPRLTSPRHGGDGAIFFGSAHVHDGDGDAPPASLPSPSTSTDLPADDDITREQLVRALPDVADLPAGYTLDQHEYETTGDDIDMESTDDRDECVALVGKPVDRPAPVMTTLSSFLAGDGNLQGESEGSEASIHVSRLLDSDAPGQLEDTLELIGRCGRFAIHGTRVGSSEGDDISFAYSAPSRLELGDRAMVVEWAADNATTGFSYKGISILVQRRNSITWVQWLADEDADAPLGLEEVVRTAAAVDQRLVDVLSGPPTDGPEASAAAIEWTASVDSLDQDGRAGSTFTVTCPPNGVARDAWGTDVYTSDSSICSAAVHAGRITAAAGGTVTYVVQAGEDEYTGSERNGVTTRDWGDYPASFVFTDG